MGTFAWDIIGRANVIIVHNFISCVRKPPSRNPKNDAFHSVLKGVAGAIFAVLGQPYFPGTGTHKSSSSSCSIPSSKCFLLSSPVLLNLSTLLLAPSAKPTTVRVLIGCPICLVQTLSSPKSEASNRSGLDPVVLSIPAR